MVTVYNESKAHAEIVAVFADDETYNACVKALEKDAKKHRMIVTESVTSESLDDLIDAKKENENLRSELKSVLDNYIRDIAERSTGATAESAQVDLERIEKLLETN